MRLQRKVFGKKHAVVSLRGQSVRLRRLEAHLIKSLQVVEDRLYFASRGIRYKMVNN